MHNLPVQFTFSLQSDSIDTFWWRFLFSISDQIVTLFYQTLKNRFLLIQRRKHKNNFYNLQNFQVFSCHDYNLILFYFEFKYQNYFVLIVCRLLLVLVVGREPIAATPKDATRIQSGLVCTVCSSYMNQCNVLRCAKKLPFLVIPRAVFFIVSIIIT